MPINISELIILAKADFLGRGTNEAEKGEYPAGEWLEERAAALHVLHAPLKPLLQGRDLICAGLTPSKRFKEILQKAYDKQLDGEIKSHDDAVKWLGENF